MAYSLEQIIEAALNLPLNERQALLDELILSLHGITQQQFDQACSAEAARREQLMAGDPTRRRNLEQVLDSVMHGSKR